MHVEPNAKFAAFFLSLCGVKADLPDEVEVEPRTWVSQRLGVEVSDHWREWLGSLATDEMKEGGLAVYVTAPSTRPEVLDAESQALTQRVNDILHGLLLQGVPEFRRGFIVNGAHVSGTLDVRQHSSIRDVQPTADLPPFLVGQAEIGRSVSLARRLRYIQDVLRPEWGRLIRGIRTLLKANRESNEVGDRLHQFVRALDGLIKPRIGSNRNDFAHRGQSIAVASAAARDVLLELYDLRSAVEHLNHPTDALSGGTEAQRIALVNQRTRQVDTLARFAFLRVLESAVLFTTFRTDAQIEAFWSLQDNVRLALWGTRIDIVPLT